MTKTSSVFVALLLTSSPALADPSVGSVVSKITSEVKGVFHVSKSEPTMFRNMFIPYEALSARQQQLLVTLQNQRGFQGPAEDFWYELGRQRTLDGRMEFANSAQRTFFANTAALAHRFAKDGTPAIDLVDSVTDVHGGVVDGPSNDQYNIAVVWKKPKAPNKSMKDMFDDGDKKCRKKDTKCTSWYDRPSVYHPGETGVQETRGGYSGLHLLFNKDNDEGHVTIAFRKTNLFESILTTIGLGFLVPSALKQGHFSPQDADIGALGPEKSHGKPIDNLKQFASDYGYDYNKLLGYTATATAENRSWDPIQIVYDDVSLPAQFSGSVDSTKQLPAASFNASVYAGSASQAI